MASTNQTQHYNLSQYVANDKPTYLVDYNGDMNKIDAGIYSAESKALVNEGAIGDITELETTVKTDLVSAINEVKNEADDNKGDITNLNTSVSANTGNIGTMANLETTDKTSLVNAINEILNDFNLDTFEQPTNITTSVGTVTANQLNTARNSKGNLGKIYGPINIGNIPTNSNTITISFQTAFRPTNDITIQSVVFNRQYGTNSDIVANVSDLTLSSSGVVSMTFALYATTTVVECRIIPCLLFIKDFGDTPSNI